MVDYLVVDWVVEMESLSVGSMAVMMDRLMVEALVAWKD
jgi:hypothetical protein